MVHKHDKYFMSMYFWLNGGSCISRVRFILLLISLSATLIQTDLELPCDDNMSKITPETVHIPPRSITMMLWSTSND